MKIKDLFEELNIQESKNTQYTALDINVQNIKHNVNNKIASAEQERKMTFMKSKKRFSLIAAAAVLAIGVTVFAANEVVKVWTGSSSAIPDYKKLPTQEKVIEDIGYSGVLIERFENGYEFDNGTIVKNNMSDENENLIEKFKSVDFRYKKDGDTVYFSQKKYNTQTEQEGEKIATENGCDIYYYSYTNKLVPPDYKLTQEDKRAEANGELVFSYGASKVEISKVQSVSWEKDGIHYLLMQIDGKLSAAELCDMAKEAVNK